MELLEQISDNIYAHTKGKTIGNVGVITVEGGNYLIDTSMYPVVARNLRVEIESIRSGKVNGVILTHYHFDHTGGLQVFGDVPLHSHNLVHKNFTNHYKQEDFNKQLQQREDKDLFEGLMLTPPNKLYDTNFYTPEENLPVNVYRVGGHTDGSSLIHYIPENVVFAGDDLFAGRYMWGGDQSASPYDWISAANKIIELRPKVIIPGHGDVQYNLKEVELLKNYLESIITIGEKLVTDEVKEKDSILALEEIDFHPDDRGLKKETVKRWYSVIANKVGDH